MGGEGHAVSHLTPTRTGVLNIGQSRVSVNY